MSGDRYTLEYRNMAIVITSPDGVRADFSGAHLRGFLAQQSRDIESLRAELVAVVAGRDQLRSKLDEIAADPIADRTVKLIVAANSERDQLRSELAAAVAERDTLRTYKAKVEAAPVVARIRQGMLWREYENVPPIGTELIAKPAKD